MHSLSFVVFHLICIFAIYLKSVLLKTGFNENHKGNTPAVTNTLQIFKQTCTKHWIIMLAHHVFMWCKWMACAVIWSSLRLLIHYKQTDKPLFEHNLGDLHLKPFNSPGSYLSLFWPLLGPLKTRGSCYTNCPCLTLAWLPDPYLQETFSSA